MMRRVAIVVMGLWACDSAPGDVADQGALDAAVDARLRVIEDAAPLDVAVPDAAPIDMAIDMVAVDMAPDRALNQGPCEVEADDGDADRDGLTNAEERVAGSNPCDHDSDGDGFLDIAELRHGGDVWDPLVGVEDYIKVPADPGWVAIDIPFTLTLQRADIFFLLDTTGSMQGLLDSLAGGYRQLVESLAVVLPDATYGVASLRDYAFPPFGSPGIDRPYTLEQQLTGDIESVQQVLNGLRAGGGGDGLESAMEALYQTLTGVGYDQNCDGAFDELTDVRPFREHGDAPFFGNVPPTIDERQPGKLGGVGFRAGALKLVVYGTDAPLRDPDAGFASPGGCVQDAGSLAVIEAANTLDAKLIGVAVQEPPIEQMHALAAATGSIGRDGSPLIVTGVQQLSGVVAEYLAGVEFERVRAETVRDDLEIGQGIAPPTIGPVRSNDLLEPFVFRIEIDTIGKRTDGWRVSVLEVRMVSDADLELARRSFIVEIPPR